MPSSRPVQPRHLYTERDLLSAIGILEALLARPGQSEDRRKTRRDPRPSSH